MAAARNQAHNLAQPLQTINGSCGSSTLTFVAIGNHRGKMSTSFVVKIAAISYHREVSFVDHAGSTTQTMGGGLAFRTTWAWNPPFTFTGSGGSTIAAVVPSQSWALLWTGDICSSAGPSQTANIT